MCPPLMTRSHSPVEPLAPPTPRSALPTPLMPIPATQHMPAQSTATTPAQPAASTPGSWILHDEPQHLTRSAGNNPAHTRTIGSDRPSQWSWRREKHVRPAHSSRCRLINSFLLLEPPAAARYWKLPISTIAIDTSACCSSNGRSCGPDVHNTSATRQPSPRASTRDTARPRAPVA